MQVFSSQVLLLALLVHLPAAYSMQSRPDLGGIWYDYTPKTGNKGKDSKIYQSGDKLTFVNEFGGRSEGHFVDAQTVIATGWEGGLRGSLQNGNKRIVFMNGSVWERSKRGDPVAGRPDLEGIWYDYTSKTGNKGNDSKIYQNGDKLTFVNEFGGRSEGYFVDAQTVIATSWEGGLRGSLQNGNKRIVFTNGSVWERSKREVPPPPPQAPLDLNGSWSGGLLHIWQDGTQVLVTATWKRDGKYCIFRAEGELNGRVARLVARYSPMTHGDRAIWRAVYTISADGNAIQAVYTLDQGTTTDRRSYVRDP